MTTPKGQGRPGDAPKGRRPGPADLLAAAQSAVEAAQSAAGQALEAAQLTAGHAFDAAVRLPPASAQLAAQLPDLIESLSTAIDRLNSTVDRLDRTLALADPAFAAYDRLWPRLEALISLGEDVFGAVSRLPGISMLGRVAGRGRSRPDDDPPATPRR